MKVLSFDQSAALRMHFIEAPLYKAHEGPIALVECPLTFISKSEYANLIIFTNHFEIVWLVTGL